MEGDRLRCEKHFYSRQPAEIVVNPKSAYHICVIKTFGKTEKAAWKESTQRHKSEKRCCTIIAIALLLLLLIQPFSMPCFFITSFAVVPQFNDNGIVVLVDNAETQDEFSTFYSVFLSFSAHTSFPLLSLVLISYFSSWLWTFSVLFSWRKQHYHLQYKRKYVK